MFTKHFARMLTREELSDDEVIVYHDIVQSVVPTKVLTAYDEEKAKVGIEVVAYTCLLYTSPSPRDRQKSRMPSSA